MMMDMRVKFIQINLFLLNQSDLIKNKSFFNL
jgi:hypothetical protein